MDIFDWDRDFRKRNAEVQLRHSCRLGGPDFTVPHDGHYCTQCGEHIPEDAVVGPINVVIKDPEFIGPGGSSASSARGSVWPIGPQCRAVARANRKAAGALIATSALPRSWLSGRYRVDLLEGLYRFRLDPSSAPMACAVTGRQCRGPGQARRLLRCQIQETKFEAHPEG